MDREPIEDNKKTKNSEKNKKLEKENNFKTLVDLCCCISGGIPISINVNLWH